MALTTVTAPGASAESPTSPPPEGAASYTAFADASVLRARFPAMSPVPTSRLPPTELDLAHSAARLDSADDVYDAADGVQHARALATTTGESTVLGGPLTLSPNESIAPPSDRHAAVGQPLALEPLLFLEAIETSTEATWPSGEGCVPPDVPVALADQRVADLSLVGVGEGSVAAIDVDAEDGLADTSASIGLRQNGQPEDGRDVVATATTRIGRMDLFNNLVPQAGSLITVDVVRSPQYTAVASGRPGGASIEGEDPVVSVSVAGSPTFELTAGDTAQSQLFGLSLAELIGVASPLLDVAPVVHLSVPVTRSVAEDGTSADVTASVLRMELLPIADIEVLAPVRDAVARLLAPLGVDMTVPLGTIDVAPIAASVTAPPGGVRCDPSVVQVVPDPPGPLDPTDPVYPPTDPRTTPEDPPVAPPRPTATAPEAGSLARTGAGSWRSLITALAVLALGGLYRTHATRYRRMVELRLPRGSCSRGRTGWR